MGIIRNFLDSLKKLWYTPTSKNTTEQKTPNSKQNDISLSLEDLKKAGVTIKPVSNSKTVKKNLVYASQLSAHIFPWAAVMKSGCYLIKFPPTIQSQINSGLFNVTGGVGLRPKSWTDSPRSLV